MTKANDSELECVYKLDGFSNGNFSPFSCE